VSCGKKYVILMSISYDLFDLKSLLTSLNARFIVLQTAYSAKLDVLLRKKLRYCSTIVNVFLYCFMALKPARSISQICVRSMSFLTDFLWNYLGQVALKLFRSLNVISVLTFRALCYSVEWKSLNKNLGFMRSYLRRLS